MRLVVLGPAHPFRGGIATTTTAAVAALRARGHEVSFLTPRRQYPAWLFPGSGGGRDPEACMPLPGSEAVLDPVFPPSWPRARRAAQRAAADAWVFPYWTWAWAGCWRYLLAGERPPVVAVVHNPADHDAGPARRLAARAVLARCDGLFTHAGALADRLARDYPRLPRAAHPLPATAAVVSIDRPEARRALGLPVAGRVALFAGLIRPYKGVDLLLDAVAALPTDSDWRLVVAGEAWGGLGHQLERRAAAPDLAGRVRLDLRWQPEEELRALLSAADLVVLPYRDGSQSAMAPLALAAGLPVLSTHVGGLPEVVEDGVNGRLVAPGSVAELTAALAALDLERLAALAAGARRSALRLTWDGYAAALEGLLERVASPHFSPPS
ncbi:MAG TPA: glycosyltransferase family 4 protein [Thermoanaerobaculales bacterium]|nr:glycosyltransferase family 4 protein [Thermoanaerobaculales bacterium]HQL29581.1 glycosyltransferase family 4 protein [Thermoanaerobaculales bacterium]